MCVAVSAVQIADCVTLLWRPSLHLVLLNCVRQLQLLPGLLLNKTAASWSRSFWPKNPFCFFSPHSTILFVTTFNNDSNGSRSKKWSTFVFFVRVFTETHFHCFLSAFQAHFLYILWYVRKIEWHLLYRRPPQNAGSKGGICQKVVGTSLAIGIPQNL